ncbi:MAG: hypothetical protein EPO08_20720 [Rhodospirillaceae bacterium]|nr:MAG: hypothetical protein EPO08_20720 [Rhodospirillaceae bacterium]
MALRARSLGGRIKPPLGARVDWSNPLTRGLLLCAPFNEGAVSNSVTAICRDIVEPASNPLAPGSTNPTIAITSAGPAIAHGGTDNTYLDFSTPTKLQLPQTASFTVLVLSTIDGGNNALRNCWRSDPGGSRTLLLFRLTTGNVLQTQFGTTTGTLGSLSGATTLAVDSGKMRHLCMVRDVSQTKIFLYLDGNQDASGTDASTGSWTLGAVAGANWQTRSNGGAEAWNGKIALICMWGRALSAREIQDLYVAPWRFLIYPGPLRPKPSLLSQTIDLASNGIASAEAFGTLKLTLFLLPGGIASAEAFGTASLIKVIAPSGVASAEAFGAAKLKLYVLPSGIASAEAFGSDDVAGPIKAGAIASAEAFGGPRISGPIKPSSIASAEAFGTANVVGPLYPLGIASTQSFGKPDVAGPISAAGAIAGAEAFGTATCNVVQSINLAGDGIASAEAFGVASLSLVQSIRPSGIASAEAFGTPKVASGPKLIMLAGISPAAGGGGIAPGIMGIPIITGGDAGSHIFIAGVDRSSLLLAAGGHGAGQQAPLIQSQTIGRWQASFDLFAVNASYIPSLGQTVLITENGKKLFSGCLNAVQIEWVMGSTYAVYHCRCVDKSGILDHRVANTKYPAGMDAAAAVRDVLANFLNGEGITSNHVPASLGALSAEQIFNFAKVTQAMDAIMTDVSGVWWIDVDGDLHTTLLPDLPAAPAALTATSGNFRAASMTATLLDYRNQQFVVSNLNVVPGDAFAGGARSVSVTETYVVPQPAAVARGFLFGALITNFTILSITSLKVNGVPQPVHRGTEFINFRSSWWYFPQTPYITPPNVQNTNPFPFPPILSADPIAGDVVEVAYVAEESNVQVVTDDPLAPPGPGTGTCGSGVYQAVEWVKNISLQGDLQAIAQAILDRSGGLPKLLKFETDIPGWAVGQKLTVDLPRLDLASSTLLITSVAGASQPGKADFKDLADARRSTAYRWTVEASTTTDLGNYVKWYERLIARTENAIPLDQLLWPTFILAPSGSLTAGVVQGNPDVVRQSGQITEVVAIAGTPPVHQDLIVDIKANGISIFNSPLVIPAGTATLVHWPDLFGLVPAFLYKDDILTVSVSYSVKGASPTPAANVTVQVRMKF